MSGLWTPGGGRPSRPDPGAAGAAVGPGDDFDPDDADDGDEPTPEQLDELRERLAATPAAVVVVNHCVGIWELAALHMSLQPPQLDEASVAIDALGAIVERLEGRLGEDESTLREALAQLRLAYVQIRSAASAGPADA